MSGDDQARLSKKKSNEHTDDKLWHDLKIDFHLESSGFPDNKIYGIVKVLPESSRRLIKKFILVVNRITRIEFDSHYENLAASGFNTKKKNPFAYIEAIPNDERWTSEPKTSQICEFYFTGKVFALSPTISFDWPKDENDAQPNLVIRWHHLGDKNAHKYILYLDGVDIQYIRQKQIDDAFVVTIRRFECGKQHTFQLVAKLSNGKETYRSDLMEFTVPDKDLVDEENMEFITVSDEPAPPNLQICSPRRDGKTEDSKDNIEKPSLTDNKNHLPPPLKAPKTDNSIHTCCSCGPHDTFPGIEHYFNNTTNRIPPAHNQSSTRDKQSMHSVDDDDDDDLIVSNESD